MKITTTITEADLRKLVQKHLENVLNVQLDEKDITIEVKSKQNYKSEWEVAAFRATVNKEIGV